MVLVANFTSNKASFGVVIHGSTLRSFIEDEVEVEVERSSPFTQAGSAGISRGYKPLQQ